MARTRSVLLRLLACAAVAQLCFRGVTFVAPSWQDCRAAGDVSRPRGNAALEPQALETSVSMSMTPSSMKPSGYGAFSRATLLPSLLLSARVTVSIAAVVARRAGKAPVSDFQAPTGVRNFQEMALGFTSDIAKNNLGESFYRPWVPFVTTIFLFIFGSNWSGAIVPWKLLELPAGELAAPTNNINTTVALSLLTSVAYFGGGLVKKGLGYFARYVKPTPILLPINILEDFTKPLSLSFRLFGNVLADELTVAVLTFLVPFVVPLPIMALGIFAGSIQALIFATLASAYIAEAIE